MAYQFNQTGAEIQDILDQVGTNTGDIAQNTQNIAILNSGYDDESATAVSCPTGSWTKVYESATYQAGTYLIECGGQFAVNSTGVRMIDLTNASSHSTTRWMPTNIAMTGGQPTRLATTRIYNITAATTFKIFAYQNSGGDLDFSAYFRIVRLR